jgi:hypothetical protein
MQKSIVALSLALCAGSLFAADVPGPAYYLKVLMDSKNIYTMQTGPVANSASLLNCPAADERPRASSDAMSAKGHFAAANAHADAGRANEAREELVKALVADPSLSAALSALEKTPAAYGVRPLVRHPFDPPQGLVGNRKSDVIELSTGVDGAWLSYGICKAVWMYEPDYRKKHGAAKEEWSVGEESACITNELRGDLNSTRTKLEEKTKGKVKQEEVNAALPEPIRHVREVSDKKLLDGYILFEVLGQRCPSAIAALGDNGRAELERYIREYVVVPLSSDSH